MANLSFAIAQVRDCVKFMDDFQQQQDGDQATYRKIADNLPNNWGSKEVAIFTEGINELSRKTDRMRQWLMDLHRTLGDASSQVESTGQDSQKKLNNVMSGLINK
jgi:uncharacterized protein YukE